MPIQENTDHVGLGLSRLISAFKGQPVVEGQLEAYLTEVQELETVCQQLLAQRGVSTTNSTFMLDLWGVVVGQPREGRDNDTYKLWLQARILLNRASGTPEEMIQILNVIGTARRDLYEYFPAGLLVDVGEVASETEAIQLGALVKLARPVAVYQQLTYHEADEDYVFTLASGDTPEASELQGWANHEPAESLSDPDFEAGDLALNWTTDTSFPALTENAGTARSGDFHLNFAGGELESEAVACRPYQDVVGSCWFDLWSGSLDALVSVRFYDAAGTLLDEETTEFTLTIGAGYEQVSVLARAPLQTASVKLHLTVDNAIGQAYADDASLLVYTGGLLAGILQA